jgi:hypothetical protein
MKMDSDQILSMSRKANLNGEFHFGFQFVDRDTRQVEFQVRIGRKRFVAYGSYVSIDEYAVEHGPTQNDVDVVSALLDDTWEPSAEITIS